MNPTGVAMIVTPPANARSHSTDRSACAAKCIATNDDEHAVSIDSAGPSRPSRYDTRPDVTLVTDPVTLSPDAVNGHAVYCVIYATGFKATDFMLPMTITARGRVLWEDAPSAHLGITVPGFPSLYLMYGPNTNTSGGSILVFHEAQAAYIAQALRRGEVEVREEVAARSDHDLQQRFQGTAWTACHSWYRDQTGRIVTNWPGYMREYQERTRRFDPAEFSSPAP